MIGRTLDAILSPFQMIGVGCKVESLTYLVNTTRKIVLPVERRKYWPKETPDNGEIITILWGDWDCKFGDLNRDSPYHWKTKRECARAFEERRKVKVGEEFKIPATVYWTLVPYKPIPTKTKLIVKRVGDNAVVYHGYLISSSKADLIKYADYGCTPVLYRGVIW